MNKDEIKEVLTHRIANYGLDLEVDVDPVVQVFFSIRERASKRRCLTQSGAPAIFPFDLMGVVLASEVIGAYAALRS